MKYISCLVFYLSFLGVLFFGASSIFALENQFTVQLNVISNDIDAPSIPTGVTATAVSVSQIDLSWNVSTDNTAVGGYTILRDGLPLATTTLTSYNDTGLVSATTYEYVVRAFDVNGNYSSSSATSSATTLTPAPPTPSSTPSNISGSRRSFFDFFAQDLRLEYSNISTINDESLRVEIAMNQPVMATIFWGQTSDYELGSASHILLDRNHVFIVDELKPETRYHIRIEVITTLGKRAIIGPYVTQTRFAKPINASDFSGLVVVDGVILSWRYQDFISRDVRLLRSEKAYPRDPFDGMLVYEGRATAIKDSNVLSGRRYYYTLFTAHSDGQYSSGAVTSVVFQKSLNLTVPKPSLLDGASFGLKIMQDRAIIADNNVWRVISYRPISIQFSLPQDLGAFIDRLLISLVHESSGASNAYLLYPDPISGLFTTEIDPGLEGSHSFVVSGYTADGEIIKYTSGTLVVESEKSSTTDDLWWLTIVIKILISVWMLLLGWLTFLGFLWF